MKDFLLFIDTEASGLPKKWDAPYFVRGNWPYALQVSWILYSKDGVRIKAENHYISNEDVDISAASAKIHGLTKAFLQEHGTERYAVMRRLQADLLEYAPLVVGHFVELDKHIAAAEFYRSGLDNPMKQLPSFCTMTGSTQLVRNPQKKYLRLGDLYRTLFNLEQPQQHNALADAAATADCFFELYRRGDINDLKIEQQWIAAARAKKAMRRAGWGMLGLGLVVVIAFIIIYCL